MPHLTIEYSNNVGEATNIQALVDAIHTVALEHPLTPEAALRTRAVGRDYYRIAEGDPRYAFVAITARIGPGRTAEVKDDFLTVLLDALESFLAANAGHLLVAISGEVQEIDHPHRINRNQIRDHLTGTTPPNGFD